ncbi:hypothetical protein ACWGQT_07360 [Streptomyces yangpuensis]
MNTRAVYVVSSGRMVTAVTPDRAKAEAYVIKSIAHMDPTEHEWRRDELRQQDTLHYRYGQSKQWNKATAVITAVEMDEGE